MGLDMGQTVLQLDQLTQSVLGDSQARDERLTALINAASRVDRETATEKTCDTKQRPYLAAEVLESLLGAYPPAEPPNDWAVAAVDGSHIDVDRHLPIACYLLNFGGCVLTYGSCPDATMFSHPHLAMNQEELYISNPVNRNQEESISGAVLGLVRTIKELDTLADTVEQCPTDLPVLGLVDGSLVMWPLSGQAYPQYVKDEIIGGGLIPAMRRLEKMSETRPVALAAYVSYPRSAETLNAVRCSLCPNDVNTCTQSCNNRRSAQQPCNNANDFLDRDLFERLLDPGWRSPIYKTNSSVSRDSYDESNKVYFFYVNAGEEIGRVEVPQWVAKSETLLSLTHSLVWDQCRRGQGYPVAISESHEQAVVNTGDRRVFRRMLIDSLEQQGLSGATSQKDRSKRSPWV
ncbi:MAG: DNA double-strand break repair nuclease NurA [Chloroflexota bacterium]|nr:DNA double-strand break repair nuclease NurA [Chloroflexota bacterium]